MLAGVGGIDHALLVVACDDGVMAQTREHRAILQLTGKPTLTVALTKADRVETARVEEVKAEVEAALAEFGFTGATLFTVAATEGLVSPGCAIISCNFPRALTRNISVFAWRSTGRLPSKARGWWSPGRRYPVKLTLAIRCG